MRFSYAFTKKNARMRDSAKPIYLQNSLWKFNEESLYLITGSAK